MLPPDAALRSGAAFRCCRRASIPINRNRLCQGRGTCIVADAALAAQNVFRRQELRQTTLLAEPGLDGRVCPGRAARQRARPVPRPGARPRSATRARSVHFVYRHRHTLGCTPYTYPVAVQRPSTAADDLSSGRPRCVRGRLNEAHRPTVDISSSVLAPLGAAKMLPVCLRS
jgi:hypothetical protein